MPTLTDVIIAQETPDELNKAAYSGWKAAEHAVGALPPRYITLDRKVFADIRAQHGLAHGPVPLLTEPDKNMKLSKSLGRPAYGLTLQHHAQALQRRVTIRSGRNFERVDARWLNACPWAGDCTRVCVLDNGHGNDPRVQRAREAKTEFFAHEPYRFIELLTYELRRAVDKHPQGIDFRPNVNSDVEWERIVPHLFDGTLFRNSLWAYGYTKNPAVLDTNGWVLPRYRVSFSANENEGLESQRVTNFLASGGSVAVVTNRTKAQPVLQWHSHYTVLDADASDEWIWEPAAIGDLAAKGKARKLIGISGFVLQPY